jgi:putative transposase
MVKVRDNHVVQNKPAYLAAGIDADGEKHVLGIWLARTPLETATAGEGCGTPTCRLGPIVAAA